MLPSSLIYSREGNQQAEPVAPEEISFFCALCGTNLTIGGEYAGRFCECSKCLRLVPVPPPLRAGEPGSWATAFPRDLLKFDIGFSCPDCTGELVVEAIAAGTTVNCPLCRHEMQIPTLADLIAESVQTVHSRGSTAAARLTPEEFAFMSAIRSDLSDRKVQVEAGV